jgi:hypothetical protein
MFFIFLFAVCKCHNVYGFIMFYFVCSTDTAIHLCVMKISVGIGIKGRLYMAAFM